ncbi:MAG: hypothetical protein ACRDIB_06125 [Ardenticatenaceae bacterium]
MNTRLRYLGIAFGVLLVALALVAIPGRLAASTPAVAAQPDALPGDEPTSAILLRRVITPTMGIDDPVTLAGNGRQVHVTGLAECPEGVDTFAARVVVSQDATGARALSRFSDPVVCTDDTLYWAVDAFAPGAATLEPGLVEVCTMGRFANADGGFGSLWWCYQDVEIQ